jgi:hypothetical protein
MYVIIEEDNRINYKHIPYMYNASYDVKNNARVMRHLTPLREHPTIFSKEEAENCLAQLGSKNTEYLKIVSIEEYKLLQAELKLRQQL